MLGLGRDILRLVSTGVTGGGGGPAPDPGYTPPLDLYPADAAAAFSVRLLLTAYSGSALRVRRAAPPYDEQDIGFTAGGDLDEAAIVAFGGSDVLTVSAWYDQSGQSNHATQINPSNQPQIYNGTAVITENGKPAIDFQISRNVLSAGSVLDVSSRDIYQWSVYSLQTGAFWTPIINGPLYSMTNQNTYQPRLFVQRTSSQPFGNSATALNIDQQYLRHDYADTSNARTFLDGDSSPVIDLVDNNSDWSTGVLEIGTGGTTPDTYMKVSEVLLWQTGAGTVPSNRPGIETNINNYYEVYPTSGFLVDHPNARASYSLRQLQNLQQYAIEVERHSDNATLDIGFVGVDLDEQAIIDFAQGGVVGVRTWYDQNHNSSRDLVQTNTANQPLIYSGSALYKVGGKCAIYYDTTTKQLSGVIGGTGNPVDIFNVHQRVSGSGYFLHWEGSGGFQVATMQTNYSLGWLGGTNGPAVDTDQHLFTVTANGTTGQIRLDGAASTAGTLSASRTFNNKFAIQGRPNFPGSNPGPVIYQQEFIQYDFNHSAGDLSNIETDIQTYYSIP